MKRSLALLLTLVMSLGLLAGCGSKDTTADESQQDGESGAKQIETLKVAFVPSREPQEIITATEPLKQLLKDELAKEGYEVGEVEITVGTTYEAVGEGLEAGTIDVGLIPGGTYVLYDDGAEVILTAYGITGRIAKSAVGILRAEGIKAGLIRPKKVYPFPDVAYDKLNYSALRGIVSAEMAIPAQFAVDVENAVRGRTKIVTALSSGGEILDRSVILEAARGLCGR